MARSEYQLYFHSCVLHSDVSVSVYFCAALTAHVPAKAVASAL